MCSVIGGTVRASVSPQVRLAAGTTTEKDIVTHRLLRTSTSGGRVVDAMHRVWLHALSVRWVYNGRVAVTSANLRLEQMFRIETVAVPGPGFCGSPLNSFARSAGCPLADCVTRAVT